MEHVGFAVDHLRLEQIRDGTHTQAEQLKAELVKLFGDNAELVPFFGGKFNVDSPAQLKRALDQVGVHVESTAEETLRALDNPIVDKLLDYRAVEMQRRQACSLLDAIAPDGRIHAYFNALGSE
jgi:DNA polymerase I-like protein with 3'-5' exonuclease and polymerase domains